MQQGTATANIECTFRAIKVAGTEYGAIFSVLQPFANNHHYPRFA